MWHSMQHWRIWKIAERLVPFRYQRAPGSLHVRAELHGLTLVDQPIPWHAEVVNVEACLRLSSAFVRKEDVTLRLPSRDALLPAEFRRDGSPNQYSIAFRLPTPTSSVTAELMCEHRVLARIPLPVLSREEFLDSLQLEAPDVYVRLNGESVACRSIVAAQCRGIIASGRLRTTTSLAPIANLGVTVEFRADADTPPVTVNVPLAATQLIANEALVVAAPRRLPRQATGWSVTWLVGDRVLAVTRVRAIRPAELRRSLRLLGARFVVDDGKATTIRRQAPAPGEAVRVGPSFLVSSSEPGLAAKCVFEIVARGGAAPATVRPWKQVVLVTDGPTAVATDLMPASDFAGLQSFELRAGRHTLGLLPLHPVPTAAFTAEGGFEMPPEFYWTQNAEDELNERLTKLMDG